MKEETPDKATVRTAKKNKSSRWTIVSALSHVVELVEDSKLCDEFWAKAEPALAFLRKKLKMTNMQIVIVAILVDNGQPMSWRIIGEFVGRRRIDIMTYSDDVEKLIERGWLCQAPAQEENGTYEGYKLVYGVVTSLRKNKVFIPRPISNMSLQELVDYLAQFITENLRYGTYSAVCDELNRVLKANTHLELCKKLLYKISSEEERFVFFLILKNYIRHTDTENEGADIDWLLDDMPRSYEVMNLRKDLTEGTSELNEQKLIENKCVDGIADPETLVLTSETKNNLLKDYKIYNREKKRRRNQDAPGLINPDKIKQKDLFYNEAERGQIARLQGLLKPERFMDVQKRLEDEGMRKGFACIFYGAPGTGKTETVLQLARQTGRQILRVDISSIKDKWVGESEKNIKSIFSRYRQLCSELETTPILLFNEADAIFSRRNEGADSSVDKMYNTMQNIILQEMEELDGILIATTNLTGSLDPAFERRFIFKVEFNKPSAQIKTRIWKSMLRDKISEADASILSSRYDFSGGQIENIVRKVTVDYVLEGCDTSLERLMAYCDTELLNKTRNAVGFLS